ncbi:hypothetical protein OSB04_005202 [Centaurea solstitialis]|uniref:DNA topoisomerase (ATP-hydrolyzing) n=1 Tax=Centaurea solstitialis TaxID=347529 RepID=A0AA38WGJ9_9ASTR|nr:hypothetical protein OSB04_005202 [Centaurea solstitialis]
MERAIRIGRLQAIGTGGNTVVDECYHTCKLLNRYPRTVVCVVRVRMEWYGSGKMVVKLMWRWQLSVVGVRVFFGVDGPTKFGVFGVLFGAKVGDALIRPKKLKQRDDFGKNLINRISRIGKKSLAKNLVGCNRAETTHELLETDSENTGINSTDKMLNVSNAPVEQVLENVDIVNLIRILGLQIGKKYDNVRSFRYGHLIIMSDQVHDYDGSHMRGLIQNFLGVLHTPIVKPINKKNEEDVISFYTLPAYMKWMKSLRGDDERKYRIKMYVSDGAILELSFNSLQVHERKKWLLKYMKYKILDFIHYELTLHSMAMLQRYIPSVVDGLKPTQRKILFCAIKKPLVEEENVEAFCGYVSGRTNYRHGMTSLVEALIDMAQSHVGTNNINLLCPNGLFWLLSDGWPRYW